MDTSKRQVVLIVEDEAIIRMNAVDAIMDAGHEVLEAENADEAIRILEARNDITIIFTDIDMPAGTMNGLRLAAAVRDRWPPNRIIATSGRVEVRHGDLPSGSLFLAKPYDHRVLTNALADVTG